jgi:hypothetical protein
MWLPSLVRLGPAAHRRETVVMATSSAVQAPQSARGRLSAGINALETDRVIGIVGAVVIIVATAVDWYMRKVTVTFAGSTTTSSTGLTLWNVRELAAWLVTIGAVVGAIALVLPAAKQYAGAHVAGIIGFGVLVYSFVAMFVLPDAGASAITGAVATATVKTSVTVGPFLCALGGLMLSVGGIAAAADSAEF